MSKIAVDAVTENLDTVIGFINDELEKYNCSEKTKMKINIAAEEIFVNISNYAYDEKTGKAEIDIYFTNDPDTVHITFSDNGKKYDPLSHNDPDITLSAEERSIGGLGIYIVKKIMDNVEYEYKDGKNILRISKILKS